MTKSNARDKQAPILVKPNPFQFALAISIVRSKPEHLSVREYILGLRGHVQVGRSGLRTLNGSGYWRAQYDLSESSRRQLESRLAELHRQNDKLRAEGMSNIASAKKRRVSPIKHSCPVGKKPKSGKNSNNEGLQNSIMSDFTELAEQAGKRTAECLYMVYKSLRQEDTDNVQLAHMLVQASASLNSTFCNSIPSFQQIWGTTAAPDKPSSMAAIHWIRCEKDVSSLVQASARSFTLLFEGLGHLSRSSTGARSTGAVLYSYIQTFSNICRALSTAATAQAEHDLARTPATDLQQPRKSKAHAPRNPNSLKVESRRRGQSILLKITQLIISLLSHLSPASPQHKALFEGFTFIILSRIGSVVYVSTFDRERSATIEGDIEASSNGTPYSERASEQRRQKELLNKALWIEAPYLITLLKHVTALASLHFSTGDTIDQASRSKSRSSASAGSSGAVIRAGKQGKLRAVGSSTPRGKEKPVLSPAAKGRLQQTLVNAIFGETPSSDDFVDYIRKPMAVLLGPPPAIAKVDEGDAKEWFRQQVWSLLGWEILGQRADS